MIFFKWALNLVPEPFRIWAIVIAIGIVMGLGSVAGWKARDYLADRKELTALKTQLEAAQANAVDWETQARDHAAKEANAAAVAAQRQKERDEQRAKATSFAAQAQLLKGRLTKLENQDVTSTGACMCEHTTECHWSLLNQAYSGSSSEVPSECAVGVSTEVRGEHVPPAAVDRESDGSGSPGR